MKLIHCADLHLDAKMTSLLPPDLAKERRTELLRTFVRMVEYAGRENVQAILIAGDLFDRRQISALARNTVLAAIREYPDITFFYITGNHERDGFLQSIPEIPENLKLFGRSWRSYDAGPVTVTGIDAYPDADKSRFASLVPDPARFHIVLMHGQITEYAGGTQEESIPLRELRGKPIDYLALGHVHAFQEGSLPPRGVWCYPGCLEGRGFDECGEHGFVLLDVDTETHTCVRQFVPFASRLFREIPVDVTGCMTTAEAVSRIGTVLDQPGKREEIRQDLCSIVLTGRVDVSCEIETDHIRKMFSDICYYLKVEDRKRISVEYGAYSRDASLKGEFVRLVQREAGLDEEEKAEIIRCGIQALAGEEMPV